MIKLRWCVCLALAACSSRPTCGANDLACLSASFSITDFEHFTDSSAREHLTLLASTLAIGTNNAFAFSDSGPLTFASASDGALLLLTWTDPNNCRPALCMSHCPHGVQCGTGARCTPGRNDGVGHATTQHWVEYGADPVADADFDLVITPASAPGCPTDIASLIDASDTTVTIGIPVSVPVHLPGPGGGGGGGVCGTDLHASTLTCTPLGMSGVADTCVTDAEYRAIFGTGLPASCATQNTTGCLDGQKGALVAPCCPGLTCRVGSACGGGSTAGGVCLP
jgi:hypothetical protein